MVLDYARAHFREPIGVAELVAAGPRSRRWLEDAFFQALDCTPRAFLLRLRLREARRCLTEHPDMALGVVAEACGYSGTRQLNAHFQKELGSEAKRFRGVT